MRIRIQFSKIADMRYTSHLDLYRTWERTLRRAGLPLAYSQGFNPRPRIQLAAALPLGMTSQCELIDVWLAGEELPIADVEAKLDAAAPPGIIISKITEVDPAETALQNLLRSAEYIVTLLDLAQDLSGKIDSILNSAQLPRQWRDKPYDLRPLVEGLAITSEDPEHRQRLIMVLSAREGRTGRPEEVLGAMQIPSERARFHRVKLQFERTSQS